MHSFLSIFLSLTVSISNQALSSSWHCLCDFGDLVLREKWRHGCAGDTCGVCDCCYRGATDTIGGKVVPVKERSSWEVHAVLNQGGGGRWSETLNEEREVELSMWEEERRSRENESKKKANRCSLRVFVQALDGRYEICVISQLRQKRVWLALAERANKPKHGEIQDVKWEGGKYSYI